MAASFCRRSFLNYKNCLFQTQKRTGYVVLIPETPEEVAKCSIDSAENLPDFSKLTSKSCHLIVTNLGQQYYVGFWELRQVSKNMEYQDVFKHVIDPLEVLSVPYWGAWGVARTLHLSDYKLMPYNMISPLNEQILIARNEKFNSESLYNTCKKWLLNDNNKYTDEQRRILQKFVWEGHVNGLELNEEQRSSLSQCFLKQELTKKKYDEKMKISKELFRLVIDDQKFAQDCPEDLLRNTSTNKKAPLEGPWIITLNQHIASRYLEYCPSRDSRMHLWVASNQLCSSQSDKRLTATQEIEDLRKARQNFANTLGFPTYAHLAVKNKMAGSIEQVHSLLGEILDVAKYAHEKELTELERFAHESGGIKHSLEMWDFPYWKRLYLKHEFDLDENVLKNYFPFSQVLLGLIALCEELFGIIIEEQPSVEAWAPDIRYFRISDEKTKQILGGFYLDPYYKPRKVMGETDSGWFVVIRSKSKICNSLPLSSLIFNFSPPEGDRPSLLYFREVEYLFEKFGQMLQHTLTEMNYSEVSGLSNIEWDAIGVTRYFLSCWLHERGTLESISGHYETGESLPSQILDNLCDLKKHMAGTGTCRRIYLANLDLELHLKDDHYKSIIENLWPKHLLFNLFSFDHHPCGFQDIFSGPWSGSYYSDIWSEMLASDIFTAFEEAGFRNQEEIKNLGKRFRSTFLALGGGCDPKEVFRRFRGRDFDPKMLMKLLSLKNPIVLSKSKPEHLLGK